MNSVRKTRIVTNHLYVFEFTIRSFNRVGLVQDNSATRYID